MTGGIVRWSHSLSLSYAFRYWRSSSLPRSCFSSDWLRLLAGKSQKGTRRDAVAVQTGHSQPLPNLTAALAQHYPTLRALVLLRGNCAAFEYYRKDIRAETQSPVYSVTKSVLSILIGIAIDEGDLRLDEKLSEIFPKAFDEYADPAARDIPVRDILTKTEGFAETGQGDFKMGSSGSEPWQWMINRRAKYPRGTHFRYDEIGSDLLSVVLSKAIKQDAARFAKQKLFDPLRIENYTWYSDAEGYLHGEIGLSLTARDMAKIGLLVLQHGRWEGKQIVSEAFMQDATRRHSDGGPPVNTAYGYQWWVKRTGDAFFASGRQSQMIYVVPKLDVVVAMSAESIRGGSQRFVDDIVMPAEAELPTSTPCLAEFGQSRP